MGLCACRGRVAASAPAGCFEQGGRTASSCLSKSVAVAAHTKHSHKRAAVAPSCSPPAAQPSARSGPGKLARCVAAGAATAPWRGCSFRRLHVTRTAEGRKRECGQCRRLRARSAAGGCACCCRSAVSPSYRCVPMGCAAAGSGGVPFLLFCVSARAIFARRVALPSPASRRRRAAVPCCYPGGAARPRSARRTLRKRCPPKFSLSLTGC